jgi:hypothetical protein
MGLTEGLGAVYYDAGEQRAVFIVMQDTSSNNSITAADTIMTVATVGMSAVDYGNLNNSDVYTF